MNFVVGSADAEIEVSSGENSEVAKGSCLMPRVGQNMLLGASPSAGNCV